MSFCVNDTELNRVYFNGSDVKSIYYNNNLVWEKYQWCGWSNATWKDIYDLCKAKQTGRIDEWPSDVVLGATKNLNYRGTFSTVSLPVLIIGIDIDGPGVLTFHAARLVDSCKDGYHDSTAIGNRIYESEIKNYVKPLLKGGYTNTTGVATEAGFIYTEYYIWNLSLAEMGITHNYQPPIPEYTQGVAVPYPYFDSSEKRIRAWVDPERYWLRSRSTNSSYTRFHIAADGDGVVDDYYDKNNWCAPAFAIG